MGNKNPEAVSAYNREYYARNAEKLRLRAKGYREDNPEAVRASQKKYNATPKAGIRNARYRKTWKGKAFQRISDLMRKYGLDRQQAEVAAVSMEGDLCAYCGEFARLVLDHNHTTGAARGMVCPRCNQIAGALEDPKLPKVQAALAR